MEINKSIGWFNCDCLMFSDFCEHYLGIPFPYSLCYNCSSRLSGMIEVKEPKLFTGILEEKDCEMCLYYGRLLG